MTLTAAALVLTLFAGARGGVLAPEAVLMHESSVATPSADVSRGRSALPGPAPVDSFILYGGPGSPEGKFESVPGVPDWQGWESKDRTQQEIYWQVSTHNAENLGDHGPGNRAYWCGQTAEQKPFWAHTPGYGSNWNAMLLYESEPVPDPSAPQTLEFDFFLNWDLEPGYDRVIVEVDSAGTWMMMHAPYEFDGSNRNIENLFPGPGVRFSDRGQSTLQFQGNDYGGPGQDRVRIRIRVQSDGAFDDQSGLFPTVGGAAQIDDVEISHGGIALFEDFEGPGPWLLEPVIEPFFGDFADLFVAMQDIDPWQDNLTTAVSFVDYGQEIRNGPAEDGSTSTGGSTSPQWDYGVPGGFVLNTSGGLSGGTRVLHNEIWSPWIRWDLPGPEDDDPELRGVILRFDVFEHLPLENGIFYQWAIAPTSAVFGRLFDGDDVLYYSQEGPRWRHFEVDASRYLPVPAPDSLRVALVVREYTDFFPVPGADATPAPWFDNVSVVKYRLGGAQIVANAGNLPTGSFPDDGQLDVSGPVERGQRDVSIVAQNSPTALSAEFIAVIEGGELTDSRVVWALHKNPLFEDELRVVPAGVYDENVVTGPQVWTGELLPAIGGSRPNRHFPTPIPGAFYPGDEFRFHLRATDAAGRITTLPADVTGFSDFGVPWPEEFTARALPSIGDASGTQPPILVYLAGGERADRQLVALTMGQLGYVEGVDYDTFFVPSPGTRRTLGLVSNAAQLDGYGTILCFAGGGGDYRLGDLAHVSSSEKFAERTGLDPATVSLLGAWTARPGDRSLVVFGSLVAWSLEQSGSPTAEFVADELAVDLIDDDVRDVLGGAGSPAVEPLLPGFETGFVVGGRADLFCALEEVQATPDGTRAHAWALPGGGVHPVAAASVLRVETSGSDTKTRLSFPFAFRFVQDPATRAVGLPARARLLQEALDAAGQTGGSGPPTATPELRATRLAVRPNPFNPRTTILLELAAGGSARVEVLDLRGRRVRRLFDGDLDAGAHPFVWDGRDDRNRAVASGAYLVRAVAGDFVRAEKVTLVR